MMTKARPAGIVESHTELPGEAAPGKLAWLGYNNPALDKATVAACPIQIDDVLLPPGGADESFFWHVCAPVDWERRIHQDKDRPDGATPRCKIEEAAVCAGLPRSI
jgi:hypothetical protein